MYSEITLDFKKVAVIAFGRMSRPKNPNPKTERVNLCLKRKDRERVKKIADYEDRDSGYVCAFLVEFGLNVYEKSGLSLTDLKYVSSYSDKSLKKKVKERLRLRQEAQRALQLERREEAQGSYEENSDSSPERETA